ncbi:MAG: universal stress protein [Acidobacteriota bacterium]
MIRFKRILFPTDFSPAAGYALDYAISLALEHEGEILLMHVLEEIDLNFPFSLAPYPASVEYRHGSEDQVKSELAKVISPQLRRQIRVGEIVVRGKPFVEIVRAARDQEADLIVLPTHAAPGLKHSHLGSTTERVVRSATCPVLVIRHPECEFAMP